MTIWTISEINCIDKIIQTEKNYLKYVFTNLPPNFTYIFTGKFYMSKLVDIFRRNVCGDGITLLVLWCSFNK